MAQIIESRMDYILFTYGLAFFLLAATCLGLKRRGDELLRWDLLGWFGLVHGLAEWLDLAVLYIGDNPYFAGARTLVMAGSFILLVEFGLENLTGSKLLRHKRWIYAPLAILACSGAFFGISGLNATCRYAFGFTGGILAWRALSLASKKGGDNTRALGPAAWAFAMYAIAAGVITPMAPFLPASILNYDSFQHYLGFPVQILRAFLVFAVSASVWSMLEKGFRSDLSKANRQLKKHYLGWLTPILIALIVLGGIAADVVGKWTDTEERGDLLGRVNTAAVTLNPDHIGNLKGDVSDFDSPDFLEVRNKLTQIIQVNPEARFVYMTGMKDGGLIFLADAEPIDSPDFSPPGSNYDLEDPAIRKLWYDAFLTGEPTTIGPYTDAWGQWVTAHVPIKDPVTGQVVAALDMDIHAERWVTMIYIHRAAPMLVTLLVCTLIVFFLLTLHRSREDAGRVAFSESRYHGLFSSMFNGFSYHEVVVDENGKPVDYVFLEVNRAFEYLTGIPRENAIGKRATEVFPGIEKGEFDWIGIYGQVALDGGQGNFEQYFAPLNKWFTVSVHSTERGHFACIFEDITSRRLAEDVIRSQKEFAENESQKLRSMIEGMDEGVVVADADDCIIEVNTWFLTAVGERREEIIGKHLRDCHSPAVADNVLSIVDDFRSGEVTSVVVMQRDMLGISVSLRLQPIHKNGLYMGVILNVIDITSLVESRRNAEAMSATLADINRQLEMAMKETNTMAERAMSGAQAKSEFLANMSHEIRTPLNAIMGFTDLLLETDLNTEQREHLSLVKSSSDSLLNLINDILDLAKIDAKRLTLQDVPFNLRDLAETSCALLGQKAFEKDLELIVRIEPGVPLELLGDPSRLKQVIMNLLGNACKFTEEGEIMLSIDLLREDLESARIRFSVRDTGVGIPQDRLKDVFEDFVQLDGSYRRKYGGTGLGLAITRRIVSLMGGEITVESKEGAGSVFSFAVDLKLNNEAVQGETVLPDIYQDLTTLVIDSNDNSRNSLTELLGSMGCAAVPSESFHAAQNLLLDAVKAGTPFRLVVNSIVSFSTECPLIKILKNEMRPEDRPKIIAVVGMGIGNAIEELKSRGCQNWIYKPVRRQKLLDTIMEILEPKGQLIHTATLPVRFDPASAGSSTRGCRVLLAEDNPVNQKVMEAMLARIGCSFDVVEDGRQALEALGVSNYDLVLMDIQMPEMDGFETTAAIRSNPAWADLPVIAMTAHAMDGDREQCLRAGMNDYVAKPVSIDGLSSVISKWVREVTLNDHGETHLNNLTPQEIPENVLNVDSALEMLGGDMDLLKEVVETFLADLPNKLEEFGIGIAQSDPDNVRRVAHSLKGAAANIAAEDVRSSAFEIEQLASNGDLDTVVSRIPELERRTRALEDAIRILLQESPKVMSKPE